MVIIYWYLDFVCCNFSLKSYLWLQIELTLLKYRVRLQTKLHSNKFNYHYKYGNQVILWLKERCGVNWFHYCYSSWDSFFTLAVQLENP